MTPNEISDQVGRFAARIIEVVDALPDLRMEWQVTGPTDGSK
jgi:hypothetical protein